MLNGVYPPGGGESRLMVMLGPWGVAVVLIYREMKIGDSCWGRDAVYSLYYQLW